MKTYTTKPIKDINPNKSENQVIQDTTNCISMSILKHSHYCCTVISI